MIFENINFLVGKKRLDKNPFKPFDENIINFLNDLSLRLIKHKTYQDIVTLGFWLRKKNINKIKEHFSLEKNRVGYGLIYHITPSNIPTNFVYSLAFGLLTGNSNIVKVPTKNFEQINIIINEINILLKKKKFFLLKKKITILKYSNNEKITKYLSYQCDIRVIWGGDKTVETLRKYPLNNYALDISFPDKLSLAIINSNELLRLKKNDFSLLLKKFFNDTLDVDQNACSSPKLVIWHGKEVKKAKKKFWDNLSVYIEKKGYLNEFLITEKYTLLNLIALDFDKSKIDKWKNNIYTINLKNMKDLEKFSNKFGVFFETEIKKFDELKKFESRKIQTITYFGFKKDILLKFINKHNLKGFDRIVPIGQALDINFYWDGYDLTKLLTRRIDIK